VSDAFVTGWKEANPGGTVTHHDLVELQLPHIGPVELGAWLTESQRGNDLESLVLARSNRLVDDLLAATELVISTPMWNFSIPSSLKAWIDHVIRLGRTVVRPDSVSTDNVEMGEFAPVGAVTAARAIVITSRGGDWRPGGPAAHLDFQEPYLRSVISFLGIPDIRFIHADHQGPNWPDAADVLAAASAEAREAARGERIAAAL
jgi:FMN-dependent NADH-azoreductase